jgi:GH25 family lysozyme M1 (1,4-beta-N-acetylmuramidase)
MSIQARVVDLFHGDVLYSDVHKTDPVSDFTALAQANIWGMIHKATQGAGNTDPAYAARTKAARLGGLYTGAYHFNTGDTIPGQVNHFFDAAQPDAKTFMCLDFEDNRASQMSLSMAVEFLQLADEQLGRTLWLYSGNRIKELIVDQSAEVREVFSKRYFWLCEYGPIARMTDSNGALLPWAQPNLWQFTGDGVGPTPHSLPGVITQGIDINSFNGTKQQLALVWPGSALTPALTS